MNGIFFDSETMPNGKKFEYTFLYDFDIADHFGETAVRDTYKTVIKSYKSNIHAMAEIYIALNMRCWFWYEMGYSEMSELYKELFYKTRDLVYADDTPYSEEELSYFFDMTD